MPLVDCQDCGAVISDKAMWCVHCGRPAGPEDEIPEVFSLTRSLHGLGVPPLVIPEGAHLPPPWPKSSWGDRRYVVTREESVLSIPYLKIPDGCTIALADDVERVQWGIGVLSVGRGATLDLSHRVPPQLPTPPGATPLPPSDSAPPPPTPRPIAGRASIFQDGAIGLPGTAGSKGKSGRPCSIVVHTMLPAGSLWIRTDGGTGGQGGGGGGGQLGGDADCRRPRRTHAGTGGAGGVGGDGGEGGNTSNVEVVLLQLPVGYEIRPEASASRCGRSKRPSTADGNDASIVIWGARGCGGWGGRGGWGAEGGRGISGCRHFIENWRVFPGKPGRTGIKGPMGDAGKVGSAIIMGPTREVEPDEFAAWFNTSARTPDLSGPTSDEMDA